MRIRINRAAAAVVTMAVGMGGTAAAQCTLSGDLDGNGVVDGADLGLLLIQWGEECPAVIDSVSPSVGDLLGGTPITITGSNLGVAQSVTVGGLPATDVVQVDASTITAVTPAGKSLGAKDVTVITNVQSAILSGAFTYYGPIPWATILEAVPDPAIITDPEWRERLIATGLPWRVRDNISQIEMLLVPPGAFMMGCSPSDLWACASDDSEYPVHEVTLTQAFYLGRYEVTQAQWTAVMGSNPSVFQNPSSQVPAAQVPFRPVEKLSWNMIQGFEAETGLRLPTEAEWEYACRAGTQTAFNPPPDGSNGLPGQLAWYGPSPYEAGNSAEQTHPVGQKQANNLGLHDMHGNVWEYVEDWWGSYSSTPQTDPLGPTTGTKRTMRGGGWFFSSYSCRASSRNARAPDEDYHGHCGFRAAKSP